MYSHHFPVTDPSYNTEGQYTAPVLLFAFLIGLQCCKELSAFYRCSRCSHVFRAALTLSSAIEAGVSTMSVALSIPSLLSDCSDFGHRSFVGLGEDPHVLAMRAPELFGVRIWYCCTANMLRELTPLIDDRRYLPPCHRRCSSGLIGRRTTSGGDLPNFLFITFTTSYNDCGVYSTRSPLPLWTVLS